MEDERLPGLLHAAFKKRPAACDSIVLIMKMKPS